MHLRTVDLEISIDVITAFESIRFGGFFTLCHKRPFLYHSYFTHIGNWVILREGDHKSITNSIYARLFVFKGEFTVAKNKLVQPFLKWAGGKRQLLPELRKYVPTKVGTYFEPFLGGGAALFDLQPKQAIVNDINAELVNTYRVIRNNIDELINDLEKHRNEKAYFYSVRELDRTSEYRYLTPVERASRLIYLNKTCYNGLFRVNSKGQFNVPFGEYKNPNIVNSGVLRAVHNYLVDCNVQVLNTDFVESVSEATKDDFIYIDPPYDPMSDTASFTGYSLDGFGKDEQIRLKETVDQLTARGCNVLLSNSSTEFIRDLYREYKMVIVEAKRAINSNAARRGKVDEVLVMNYGTE